MATTAKTAVPPTARWADQSAIGHFQAQRPSKGVHPLLFQIAGFSGLPQRLDPQWPLQPQIANKLAEWLDAGLQEWDISRMHPYLL